MASHDEKRSETSPMSRGDTERSTRRDLERMARRAPDSRFFRALGLVGSVGWPIVLLALGGALLGRLLDTHFGTGIRFAGGLLMAGAALGTYLAFRSLRGEP